jgi:membrane protease YdiL (CAAX protease family)
MGIYLDVIVFLVIISIYSLVITHVIPKKYYSLSNILIALGSIVYGLVDGVNLHDMAIGLHAVGKSVIIVAGILLFIAVILSLAYLVPPLKKLMSDGPSKRSDKKHALNELLVRVPFGTALSEEIIFRGVLLGMLLQDVSRIQAIIASAVAFGLWHVVPTLQTVRANDAFKDLIGDQKRHHAISIVTTVLVTGVAGVVFAWLRLLADNLIAPWLVHTFINGFAIGNAYIWLIIAKLRQAEGQNT